MANIVIIHYGGVKVDGRYKTFIFYEGLIEALRKNGNDVMEIITNDFLVQPWGGTNKLKSEINKSKLINDIVDFKPDLVISFNNSSIDGLDEIINCPIVIWGADYFYHFNDLEKLKANKDRFIYFCAQSGDIVDCQKIIGANPKKCFFIKPATSIKAGYNQKKKNNIIFIGSPFNNHSEKEKLHKYKKEFIELGKKIIKKEVDTDELAHAYKKINNVRETILDFGSVANRTNILSHIAPLGLKIHGGEGWWEIGLDSSLDIFDAYDPAQVYSVSQTQEVYNGSKIGININHSQAKTGFSWRVMDILASSAVLVSNYSPDLERELGDLSREIIYHSPQEAYEICSKLLKNDELRKRIIKRSNEIVNKYHTWEIRIVEIEKAIGIKLQSNTDLPGKYVLLSAENYYRILTFNKKIFKDNLVIKDNLKIRDNLLLRDIVKFISPYGIVKNFHLIKSQYSSTATFLYGMYKKMIHRKISLYQEDKSLYNKQQRHYEYVIIKLKKRVRGGKKIRVCFFVMLDSAFAARPLYEEMLRDNFFDPFIVVIPDTSRGAEHMKFSFDQACDSLSKKYSKVFKGYENGKFYDFSGKIDMVYFPTSYTGMTHEYFEIGNFTDKEVLLFYISYSFSVTKFLRKKLSQPAYSFFWKVFVESKEDIKEFRKYQSVKGENAVISGYCKMDGLANQKIIERRRKRIIIAPHHTISKWKLLKISNFLKYYKFFQELPKLYPDIDFVFRPHPLLIVQLRKPEIWGEKRTGQYFHRLEEYPNVTYSKGGEYFDIFANSDGIIHDCGSFLAEYLFTEKPACYMLKDEKSIREWFLPIGEKCLDYCYKAYSEKDIVNYIDNVVIGGEDTLEKKRIKFVNSELKINYPKSSEFVLNYIKKVLIN